MPPPPSVPPPPLCHPPPAFVTKFTVYLSLAVVVTARSRHIVRRPAVWVVASSAARHPRDDIAAVVIAATPFSSRPSPALLRSPPTGPGVVLGGIGRRPPDDGNRRRPRGNTMKYQPLSQSHPRLCEDAFFGEEIDVYPTH